MLVILTNRNGLNRIANTLLIHQELRAYQDSLYEIPQPNFLQGRLLAYWDTVTTHGGSEDLTKSVMKDKKFIDRAEADDD